MPLKCRTYKTNLPFRHPFTISKGTKTSQPALVVELEHRGLKGYGEAPAISYYEVTVEKMQSELERKKALIEKFSFTDPERFWHYLHHAFPQNPFLVCALDMAGWDLFGKITGRPLWQIWNLDPAKSPLTDYTIGIDHVDAMLAKMKEKPWPIYKIKVGQPGDMETVSSLRRHTDAVFRVDANAGWNREEAREKIQVLKSLDVELVEQPLPKESLDDMLVLMSDSPLPLIADESCVGENDVDKCSGRFHGINIKLTKCGGITPARRMIQRARELGLRVMLGCMNESSIGSAAMAHMAPLVDYLDMDGPLLLAKDNASGLQFDFGKVILPMKPGLGILPDL